MATKKPAALLGSSNTVCWLCQPTPPPTSRRRTYASAAAAPAADPLSWPQPPPPRAPTPYEIFAQPRDAPYSKRRFYELVKLYHPDAAAGADVAGAPRRPPRPVMLERYRLVVAANAILADPARRRAYDRSGAGWGDALADPAAATHPYSTVHRWRAARPGPRPPATSDDPMFNATWEDWERWYAAAQGRQRRGSSGGGGGAGGRDFFRARNPPGAAAGASNAAIVSVVLVLAALGGAGQATRANAQAATGLERSRAVSAEAAGMLQAARASTREHGGEGEGREARVRRFLRDKERYGEGEVDGRALRAGDEALCASGEVKDRGEPRFWTKPPEQR